jgi:hypothetical protein
MTSIVVHRRSITPMYSGRISSMVTRIYSIITT